MTIETGFGKEFSEPPSVTVSGQRTHCEACKEPLDPSVMHKCHGNKAHEPPQFSSTEITEACPECGGPGVMLYQQMFGAVGNPISHTVVCGRCNVYLWPLVQEKSDAIYSWNAQASTGRKGCWPLWLVTLPGAQDGVRQTPPPAEVVARHPNLTNYKGVCPKCHGGRGLIINADTGENPVCDLCENTGTIPPTKPGVLG